MEIWIRTQDRENLFKVDNAYVHKDCVMYEEHCTGTSWNLGIYKSHERALEVLDEIQKLLIEWYQSIDYQIVPVYEMPKE